MKKLMIILLIIALTNTECFLVSMIDNPKNNIVKNKKGLEYKKCSNDNEKYLYANYLVSLRKLRRAQKSINYNIFTNIVNNSSKNTENTYDNKDITLNNANKTIINNDQKIAKTLILSNIKIDVSNVKYIQISTKNDTMLIELDKNNEDVDKGFVNYDLGKIDALISAISILMNLLNIH